MSTKVWLGGAAKKAQVDTVTIPSDIATGQLITASIGYKSIEYTVLSTDSRNDVIDELVTKWNSSIHYEFQEVTASVGKVDSYDTPVYSGDILLTAVTPGIPFVVVWTIGGGGSNEKQTITISGATGGTFTITFGGYTTSAIAYNETAANIETELEGLTSIGAGNVSVTGDAGGPWVVEFIGDLAGTDVSPLIIDGSNLTTSSEVQVIDLGGPTGGTFKLKYGYSGTLSSSLNYNATAAEVKAAIEGLTEVSSVSGTVTVTGSDGGPWTVEFGGGLVNSNVQPIMIDDSTLTGGLATDVTIAETTAGGGGINETWGFHLTNTGATNAIGITRILGSSSVTGGTFDLSVTIGGSSVLSLTNVPYDATCKELQDLIIAALGSSTFIHVSRGPYGSNAPLSAGISIELSVGSAQYYGASSDTTVLTLDSTNLVGGSYAAQNISDGSWGTAVPTGAFYITLDDQTTAAINWSDSDSVKTAAIAALSNVGSGNVSVTTYGNATLGYGLIIEFTGDFSGVGTGFNLYDVIPSQIGGSIFRYLLYPANAGTSEVQTISVSGSPVSGKFAFRFNEDSDNSNNNLTYPSTYSPLVNYNATASEIQSALEATDQISSGEIECTGGPLPGTDVVVSFKGNLSGVNVALMTAVQWENETTTQGGTEISATADTTQGAITHTTTTQNEGPNDWTTVDNWSTAELPVDGDKVYIIDNAYSILYGLDQASVTLAELHIEQTYTGLIGLPVINVNSEDATISYPEYRDQYLKIGATNVYIGDKDGDGSQRLKINFGSVQTTILVTNSGGRLDDATPPIQFLGTHASNVLNINRGDVAIAFYPGEVSAFPTIRQAFIDNAEADATLYVGDDVTLTNIYKSGGIATLKSATTLIDQTAGTLTIEEGAHAEINSFAGQVYYNSIDTLSLIDISGDTTLSFDQDRRPKDVTLIKVNGSEPEVYDQSNAIASPKVNLERGATNQQLYFGSKILLTISSIS